jgi:hypothetical protein
MSEAHKNFKLSASKLLEELHNNAELRRKRFERWFRETYGELPAHRIDDIRNILYSPHRRFLDDAIAALEEAKAYSAAVFDIPLYEKLPDGSFVRFYPKPKE